MPCEADEMLMWVEKSANGLTIFLATIVFIVVTSVVNVFHPNADVSNKYFTLITPPGYAFIIWAVIYAWELLAGVLAIFPFKTRRIANRIFDKVTAGVWVATVMLQILWSVLFQVNVIASGIPLLASVLTLWAQQSLVQFKLSELPTHEFSEPRRALIYLAFVAPFSLHAGWTTAAAALNANIIAVAHSASPSEQLGVALCSLLVIFGFAWTVAVFGTGLTGNRTDPAWTAGAVWALFAIAKHENTRPSNAHANVVTLDPATSPVPNGIVIAAQFAAAVLLVAQGLRFAASIYTITRAGTWKRTPQPTTHHDDDENGAPPAGAQEQEASPLSPRARPVQFAVHE